MTGYLVEVNNWPTKRQSYLLILLSQNLKARYKLLCTVLASFIVHIFKRIKRCILFGKCMAIFFVCENNGLLRKHQKDFSEFPKLYRNKNDTCMNSTSDFELLIVPFVSVSQNKNRTKQTPGKIIFAIHHGLRFSLEKMSFSWVQFSLVIMSLPI